MDQLFSALGHAIIRFRYMVVIVWVATALLIPRLLPSLSSVADNNNSAFLPANSPSMQAALLAGPFQQGSLPTATFVASRRGGALTAADQTTIDRVEAAMRRVSSVVLVRDQGVSADGSTRRALVELSGQAAGGQQAEPIIKAVRAAFGTVSAPPALSFYLTGQVASIVDNQSATNDSLKLTELLSVIFILVLLFGIYRSLLAPFITLLPAALVVVISGPVIAEAHQAGLQVSAIVQFMLIILVLGAGADYGLFLIFRVREEMQRGLEPNAALVKSLMRVGETITFSACIVIGALLCLLLASLGIYQGMGPSLAIAIALMLLAGLTLTPALLAIAGRAAFWPLNVRSSGLRIGVWGKIAAFVLRQPAATLAVGLVLFGGLSLAVTRYDATGFGDSGTTSSTSQSAQGTAVLGRHYPAAQANPTNVLLHYPASVWQQPELLTRADKTLRAENVFKAVSGPLNPNGTPLTAAQIARLHAALGPAISLPRVLPTGSTISPVLYSAYRSTAQFISVDGRTVQFYATLTAGAAGSNGATQAIPSIRTALARAAAATGADANGLAGETAVSYDLSTVSNNDILHIVPVVLLVIGVLLALVLRSLVAPLYLIASVGLSYLAALGLAVVVFMGVGGSAGLAFVLPFFMFIFLMALGSDYNVLVMTRIREEARAGDLKSAVIRAINATGGTVTSAGLILAGSFAVLTVTGGGQIQQIGLGIAAGILMDTFLIRTLLIPSLVVLIGRWNWWPSALGQQREGLPAPESATSSEVA